VDWFLVTGTGKLQFSCLFPGVQGRSSDVLAEKCLQAWQARELRQYFPGNVLGWVPAVIKEQAWGLEMKV